MAKKQTQKKLTTELEYKMYFLVPYNISDKQQGIQALHGVVEYAQKYFKHKDYQQWAVKHKTAILLSGGTTNEGRISVTSDRRYSGMPTNDLGTMQKHWLELDKYAIKKAWFHERDLNNAMSAIVFLVDERVFNKKKYPEPINILYNEDGTIVNNKQNKKKHTEWCKLIGGEANIFLRKFLPNFKLA